MVNTSSIERNKNKIIRKFKPEEMTAYLESLIVVYYQTFIEQDLEKHLAVSDLIKESVKIYEKEGYDNTEKNEIIFKLNKANELLGKTLEEKDKQKIELSKVIVENSQENYINILFFCNSILRRLLESYEKTPSEELASAVKDVAERVETEVIGIKFFLENKHEVYNSIYAEVYSIIEEEYLALEKQLKQINKL